MALTVALLGSAAEGTGTTASGSFTVTEGANQTLYAAFAVDFLAAPFATAPTFNGDTMELVAETTDLSPYLCVWRLKNPDSGSAFTLTGPDTGESRAWRLIALILDDNDQTTPNDSPGTNYESGSTAATTKTTASATGDLVLSFGSVDNKTIGAVSPAGSGQTQLAEINGDGAVYLGASWTAGAASIDTTWAWSGAISAAEIAFNVNAAAAGGGGLTWLAQTHVAGAARDRVVASGFTPPESAQ